MITVPIIRLPHGEDLPLPAYATTQSAGVDLYAAIALTQILAPMDRVLIPCGIAIALPDGYEAQIRPRSGLALKSGITLLNTPGTIDADYRGEIKALLINLDREPVSIERGIRIAQLIVAPVTRVAWSEVKTLDETERASGGFGSTGMK